MKSEKNITTSAQTETENPIQTVQIDLLRDVDLCYRATLYAFRNWWFHKMAKGRQSGAITGTIKAMLSVLKTIPGPLAAQLLNNMPKGFERTYHINDMFRTIEPANDRKFFLTFFKYAKDVYGMGWIYELRKMDTLNPM